MSLCLIVQKDTLENDKVKSVVKSCQGDPKEFMRDLQRGHCIEYQLLAYTSSSDNLTETVLSLIHPYKTSFGLDWYDFSHETLAQIITLFLESDECIINLKSISNIIGFSLKMFPVISKEIRVSSLSSVSSISSVSSVKEFTEVSTVSEVKENRDKEKKDELMTLLEGLEKVEKSDKSDKVDRKDRREGRDKKDKKR